MNQITCKPNDINFKNDGFKMIKDFCDKLNIQIYWDGSSCYTIYYKSTNIFISDLIEKGDI
jgi:hypothetical protein